MANENYKPNSFKSKEEPVVNSQQPKVVKTVKGPVTVKKKSGFQKFASNIISEDLPKVKEFVVTDVLIPSIKKAISDIVRNGIDMFLYGADAAKNRNINSPASKVSYQKYYNNPNGGNAGFGTPRTRTTYSYDDIVIRDRGEAEMVLDQMNEIISAYGFVRVADYYEIVGVTGTHTDHNYGWTNISSAQIVRTQDGYLIKLPRVMPID